MNKYQEALNNLIINSCLVAIGSKEPCSIGGLPKLLLEEAV